MKHFLIVAHIKDKVALEVSVLLGQVYGPECVKLVALEELLFAPRWSHRITPQDGVETYLRLADKTEIHDSQLIAVFNRLRYVAGPYPFSAAEDNEYAVAELSALLLSWLAGLHCPVLNLPSTRGFSGAERGALEWLQLAAKAGLSPRGARLTNNGRRFWRCDYHVTALAGYSEPRPAPVPEETPLMLLEPIGVARKVIVVGPKVVGDAPTEVLEGCLTLSRLSQCALLECSVAPTPDASGWRFLGATPSPEELPREPMMALIEFFGRLRGEAE